MAEAQPEQQYPSAKLIGMYYCQLLEDGKESERLVLAQNRKSVNISILILFELQRIDGNIFTPNSFGFYTTRSENEQRRYAQVSNSIADFKGKIENAINDGKPTACGFYDMVSIDGELYDRVLKSGRNALMDLRDYKKDKKMEDYQVSRIRFADDQRYSRKVMRSIKQARDETSDLGRRVDIVAEELRTQALDRNPRYKKTSASSQRVE